MALNYATVTDATGNLVRCPIDPETGEIIMKNPAFVQFVKAGGGLEAVEKLLRTQPRACSIFIFMVRHMDDNNRLMISYEALMSEFDISRSTANRSITYLVEHNFLKVIKSGNSNIYCLNANVVWQNSAENRQFASFACSVFTTKKEQQAKPKAKKKAKKTIIKKIG